MEWKIIYVGCAESEEYDQVLDSVYVGPVPEGRHMFVFQVRNLRSNVDKFLSPHGGQFSLPVFQANPPEPTKIPVADAVGVTVVLLTCSYRSKEFIRVGYYVNNEYTDPESRENVPTTPQFDKVMSLTSH